MKSLRHLSQYPSALPLAADDVTELHAARLLLLMKLCGQSGRIDGLTKLAKLDFFVRYPAFLQRAAAHLQKPLNTKASEIDSEMVRHHYGPWDKRYYSVLPFLESHRLITVRKEAGTYVFALTDDGQKAVKKLSSKPEFSELAQRMREVKKLFGHWKGSSLKDLVYEVFENEVGKKAIGEIIS